MISSYTTARQIAMLATLPLLALVVVGCGLWSDRPQSGPGSDASTEPDSFHGATNPANLYPRSLDQMITRSDVIVRASLLSAAAATETLSGAEGVSPTYRPLHKLRFTVHEYIKGSGSAEIVVIVRPRGTLSTEADAHDFADLWLSPRNTTWDDRQALLFLIPETRKWYNDWYDMPNVVSDPGESLSVDTFVFPRSGNNVQSIWKYTIDTLARVWLPSSSAAAAGASGDSADIDSMEFIAGEASYDRPVISLADFRAQKEELEALLKAGEGIEGYAECIAGKLAREQHTRANPDWPTPADEKALGSGLGAGTEVYRETQGRSSLATAYHNYWLSGPDMDLFQAVRIDDDSDPKNGYDHTLETARPLTAGVYDVRYNRQHYYRIPCNYKPDDAYVAWTVTVTAPSGTVHEAFFDPVAIGKGVGADAANGTLSPAEFIVNGSSSALQSLMWQDGSATLTLSPYASLAGGFLDVIGLDGSVAHTLSVAEAAVDSAAGTLTWTAASQPWSAGDRLMLRIRDVPYISDVTLTMSPGASVPSWTWVTLTAGTVTVPAGAEIEAQIQAQSNDEWRTASSRAAYKVRIIEGTITYRAAVRIAGSVGPYVYSEPVTITWDAPPPTPTVGDAYVSEVTLTVSPGTLVPNRTLITHSVSATAVPLGTAVETLVQVRTSGGTWNTLPAGDSARTSNATLTYRGAARIRGSTGDYVYSEPVTVTWGAPPTPAPTPTPTPADPYVSEVTLTVSPGTSVPNQTWITYSVSATAVPSGAAVEALVQVRTFQGTWNTLPAGYSAETSNATLTYRGAARIKGSTGDYVYSEPVTVTWGAAP